MAEPRRSRPSSGGAQRQPGSGSEPHAAPARGGGWAGGGAAGVAFPGAIPERGTQRCRATSPAARQQVWRLRAQSAPAFGSIGFLLALVHPAWRGASGAMPMDVILVLWFCVCTARTGKQGWALGIWGKVVVVVALSCSGLQRRGTHL